MSARAWILAGAVAAIAAAAIALAVSSRGAAIAPVPPAPAVSARAMAPDAAAAGAAPAIGPTASAPAIPAPTAAAADAAGASDAPLVAANVATDGAPTPRDEREALLRNLRESGAAHEAWDDAALRLLGSITHGPVDGTSAGCFVAGCGMTYTFPSAEAAERGLAELRAADAYRAWTGGKQLTSPEVRADGTVVIAVVLYRPD